MSGNAAQAHFDLIPELPADAGAKIKGELSATNIDGAGTSMGKGLAKKLVAAFAAVEVGKAIAGLISDSVQQYAEFEQLAGGVEKIFDGMDTSRIFEDADNAYKTLNLSASDYLATINDVGASFASTMGAEAGYDVAKQGLTAISDYASGTGKSIDELKEKFALITRSTASYQSIADQFSGILPATSADFLEQAQAAGFLSDSYTQLTQVPIDEYQAAVAAMLEQGTAALNLAGNTAAEAEGTLSGSFATLGAAWDNFITQLANPEADLEESVSALVESIGAVIQNLIPVIGEILQQLIASLPELIMQLGPVLLTALGELFIQILDTINQFVSMIGDFLLNGIVTVITGFMNIVQGGASAIAGAFSTMASAVVTTVQQMWADTVSRVTSGVASMVAVVQGVPGTIKGIFSSAASWLVNSGRAILDGLISGFQQALGRAKAAISNGLSSIRNLFPFSPAKEGPFSGKGWTEYSGMSIAESIGSGFRRGISAAYGDIERGMDGLHSRIESGFEIRADYSASENGRSLARQLKGMGIYIDGRALVGQIAPNMDSRLGGMRKAAAR